jgi:putative ABC transport system substrate-binding protein
MDRRRFLLTSLAGALAAPLTAGAQRAAMTYRIGVLATSPPEPQAPAAAAFIQGLNDHGYVEGQNLQIESRYSRGQTERLPALAAELVQLGVAVIVAFGPSPSRAAKEATATTPIVFVGVTDPIGFGLVASLARPGGNVTGLASVEWEAFQAKQLELIKAAVPKASRVAILMNPTNPNHPRMLPQEQVAAESLGVKLQLFEARSVGDLESAFAAAMREHADVVHIYADVLTFTHRVRIAELALKHRLPTMHFFREAVVAGGLLSFGPDLPLLYRSAGRYVDKILGRSPPTFRQRNLPSTSWSSTSRPPRRSASRSRLRCCCARIW